LQYVDDQIHVTIDPVGDLLVQFIHHHDVPRPDVAKWATGL
jgi:hypothetical protein